MTCTRLGLLALSLSCGESPPDSELYVQALSAADGAEAIQLCRAISQTPLAEECVAMVIRSHPEQVGACETLEDPRWAGECWFSIAETQATDRWQAMNSCARAGPYLQECLYHLWTSELSVAWSRASSIEEGIRATRPIVEFWSGADHLLIDAEGQLWRDLWFFAIRHHGPADMRWCSGQEGAAGETCAPGLSAGVQRALIDSIEASASPIEAADRACRSGQFSASSWSQIALDHPPLLAAAEDATTLACALSRGETIPRWSPVFVERDT